MNLKDDKNFFSGRRRSVNTISIPEFKGARKRSFLEDVEGFIFHDGNSKNHKATTRDYVILYACVLVGIWLSAWFTV
jgi:hypothetical protein